MALVRNSKRIVARPGDPSPYLQPDSEITVDDYGVMRGTAVFEFPAALAPILTPALNISRHPKEPRLTCYEVSLKYSKLQTAVATAQYIGLLYDPSLPKIEFAGGSGQDPIETHPDFVDFAGTPEDPQNGATFDENTGEFIGFTEPGNFQGVRSYIVPSVIVNYSYYTSSAPSLASVGRIFGGVPGFRRPPNVRNFLLVGMPYRQTANIYFVTEQYLGSGERGWNREIY